MFSNKLLIVTAPSGSGKTTLVRRLLKAIPQLRFSISACTRNPRNGEQHGVDYYFLMPARFQELVREGAFLEWEMVYEGKYYGTLHQELLRIWEERCFPLVDIDVKGALAIRSQLPQQAYAVFIQPPSLEELRSRLIGRGTETPQSLEERVEKAAFELTFAKNFDAVVVNDVLDDAFAELQELACRFLGIPQPNVAEPS